MQRYTFSMFFPTFVPMINRLLFFLLGCVVFATTLAQKDQIHVDHIKTLVVNKNNRWQDAPVIRLKSTDYIQLSFDDLTHEYKRYIYIVEHCDAQWNTTEGLFESDYIEGFNGSQPIENYQYSVNTTQLYTHYALRIPNSNIKPLVSGNYRVRIYEDDDYENETEEKEPVITVHFQVVEPIANIRAALSTNTDIDWNEAHQQMTLSVDYGSLVVRNPEQEIYTVIRQNRRWDNAVIAPKPNYVLNKQLKWEHNRQLIFDGGNEYRRFELESMRYASMGVEKIRWHDPFYHVTLFSGQVRKNYVYDEDQDGKYIIHNEKRQNDNIESDYAFIHFTLQYPDKLHGKVYLNGGWTHDNLSPEYELHYNEQARCYEASVFLKQGYYNYQYIYQPASRSEENPYIEGNFYQTENEYDVFVYYRSPIEKYDRLIGYATYTFNPNK